MPYSKRRSYRSRRPYGGRKLRKRQYGAVTPQGAASLFGGGKFPPTPPKSVWKDLSRKAEKELSDYAYKQVKGYAKQAYNQYVKQPTYLKQANPLGGQPPRKKMKFAMKLAGPGRTMSAPGHYGGIFGQGRPRISKGRQYGINGSTLKYETGGQIKDQQCIYLGHAVAFSHVIKGFWRALVSTIFAKSGIHITNWEAQPFLNSITYTLRILYRTETAAMENSLLDYGFAANLNYEEMAGSLWTQWQVSFGTGKPVDIYNVSLLQTLTDTGADTHQQIQATMYMSEFYIEIDVKSTITIQNVTVAGPDTEATLDAGDAALKAGREQMTNINSNPLVGKMYSTFAKNNHWRNGFLEKYRRPYLAGGDNTTAAQAFLSDPSTGTIKVAAGTDLSTFWEKPPASWAFEDKPTTQKVAIEPAAIKKDSWGFHTKMGIGKFFFNFAEQINQGVTSGTTSPLMIPFGFAKMIGLERRLDDRTEACTMTLHYQQSQRYSIKLHQSNQRAAMPIVVIA